jgi:hypothetical protein
VDEIAELDTAARETSFQMSRVRTCFASSFVAAAASDRNRDRDASVAVADDDHGDGDGDSLRNR